MMAEYIVKGGKALRLGYTTGSCAAAAAAAAAEMLVTGEPMERVSILLPNGETAVFFPDNIELSAESASCSVCKDAGDDPDVTHGLKIFARCSRAGEGLTLNGGEGVGLAACAGLPIPKGKPAINPVPRRMILEGVEAARKRHGYSGGLDITISVPGGAKAAENTFNPRLGIVGGISILGTTGRVEPMSERAIIETIRLDIDRRGRLDPDNILITPGNYGRRFCSEILGIELDRAVKYSNFLGECLDYLVYKGFRRVLLVGHAGKLTKAAGGIFNTHSSVAGCLMEIITAHAALAGADAAAAARLMECPTTEAAMEVLKRHGLSEPVAFSILEKILFHIGHRVKHGLEVGVIVFYGERILMKSDNAMTLAAAFAGRSI